MLDHKPYFCSLALHLHHLTHCHSASCLVEALAQVTPHWGTGLIPVGRLGYRVIEQSVWTLLLHQWYWSGRSSNLKHGPWALSKPYEWRKAYTAWTFCPCRENPGTSHTTKMGSLPLVLITHFAAEIILIAFLNQGCERPSSGFECQLTTVVAECIRWI